MITTEQQQKKRPHRKLGRKNEIDKNISRAKNLWSTMRRPIIRRKNDIISDMKNKRFHPYKY